MTRRRRIVKPPAYAGRDGTLQSSFIRTIVIFTRSDFLVSADRTLPVVAGRMNEHCRHKMEENAPSFRRFQPFLAMNLNRDLVNRPGFIGGIFV